ncbi:MAG: type II secretion system protein GspD [Methylomonas sp.]
MSGAAAMGGGQIFVSNVKIVADDANNALVIVANSEDYAKILPVLNQLDVLPLQVIIDATIAEVTLNDDLKYGIQWFFTHNNGGTNVIKGGDSSGGFDFGNLAADAAKAIGSGGFTYAFSSGSKDINAVLRASALKDNVNVISSPSLMVLNNQEAQIRVGDSVPILTGTSTSLVSTGVTSNQIQMVDTGVQLMVKPRVNAGGLVLMEIQQSVDDAKPTTGLGGTGTSNINSPTISKRQIDTSVAVQSGETIVLGGLIKNADTHNRDGVPFLHELPLIGPIFGFTERKNEKTELVVLLTPRVMKSRQDALDVTDEFKRKLTGIYDVTRTEIHE